MLPTLISLGPLTISSFGFFLAWGFLLATFLAWRLARAWDLPEEKVLDLCLLTFFGSLIGARIFFVLENLAVFNDFTRIFLLTKYPGLDFWGGLFGGTLTLFFFIKRVKRLSFWQMADLAAVGLLGGIILGQLGCLLGGCNVGVNSQLGVDLVGYLGKRFPVQALEALIFVLVLSRIWPVATHFHFPGKIASLTLIVLGSVELALTFLKDDKNLWPAALIVLVLGIYLFYRLSKRNIKSDLFQSSRILWGILTDEETRGMIRKRLSKSWYAQRIAFKWSTYQLKKRLRRVRVKPTPES